MSELENETPQKAAQRDLEGAGAWATEPAGHTFVPGKQQTVSLRESVWGCLTKDVRRGGEEEEEEEEEVEW